MTPYATRVAFGDLNKDTVANYFPPLAENCLVVQHELKPCVYGTVTLERQPRVAHYFP